MSKTNVKIDKTAYRVWCKTAKRLPIFFQDWWLDIVCQMGKWDVMLYYHDPKVVAIFPYFFKEKGLFSYLCMPPLTKFLGPYFVRGLTDAKNQFILQTLLGALPSFDSYDLNVHYHMTNCLPFQWSGFRENVQYSYVLEKLNDLQSCWNSLSADYRNNKIARAKELVEITQVEDSHGMIPYFLGPFKRKGIADSIDPDVLSLLMTTSNQRNQGKVFQAIDKNGQIHAAAFVVWDDMSAKLLLMADEPGFRSSGAGIYLIWQIIEFVHYELQVSEFDFLGSMIPGVERVRRSFGATQRKYSYLHKSSKVFRVLKSMKDWLS